MTTLDRPPAATRAAPPGERDVRAAGGRVAGPPLRIAFCIDSLAESGGTELNAVRTAERLDPTRFAVELITMRPDGPMRARYEAAGIPVHYFGAGGSLVGPDTWPAARRLANFLRARRFDVVHCHDRYSNVFCGLTARAAGVPGVVTSKRWWRTSRAHRALNALAYRASHRVLANSAAVGASLRAMEWVPAARIVVVPNFVDAAAFTPPAGARERLRARWGVPAQAPVAGVVARLRPVKDLGTAVRAIALLTPTHPDLRLVIAGEGEEEHRLRALADSLGVADRVHLVGHVPHADAPHAAFDVSLLCSLHEGFPNTVVEAMAVARPVVATAVGGIADAVAHGETGVLVPPANPDRLAEAVAALIASPARARAMGEAGARRARARFTADAVLARLGALYDELAPRTAARPDAWGAA